MPAVAVTVTGYAPFGVIFCEPAAFEAQPVGASINSPARIAIIRRGSFRLRSATIGSSRSPAINGASGSLLAKGSTGIVRLAVATLVAIVRVVVTGVVLVGVSELGLNVQVANVGNPLQANVVGAANPFTGVSVIVIVAELPAVIVPVGELNAIEKSGGDNVIVTTVAVDTDATSLLSPP